MDVLGGSLKIFIVYCLGCEDVFGFVLVIVWLEIGGVLVMLVLFCLLVWFKCWFLNCCDKRNENLFYCYIFCEIKIYVLRVY